MNKEIINKLQKELDIAINKKETIKGGLGDVYRKSYYDLKDRIDEAIEYIENCEWEDYPIQTTTHHKLKEEIIGKVLLNILKGEE